MTSYGDVRSWSPAALEGAAADVAMKLATLTGLQDELAGSGPPSSWLGDAAIAASEAHEAVAERLQRLVAQAAAVQTALNQAGDSVTALLAEVDATATFAASWQFVIGDDGSVRDNKPPGPPLPEAEAAVEQQQRQRAVWEIVDRIEQTLRTAADVDIDLTSVLTRATNGEIDDGAAGTLAQAATAGAAVGGLTAVEPPPGATPADNSAWWGTLSPGQREQLLAQHPEWLGNRDGIPATTRSQANLAMLPGVEDGLRRQAAELQGQIDGASSTNERNALTAQLKLVTGKLDATGAIERTMARGDRKLLLLDMSQDQAMAAVAVGDVDTADNVSVFTPGMGTTVQKSLLGQDEATALLRNESEAQFARTGRGGSVAAVTWIGYQAPATGDASTPDGVDNAVTVAGEDAARRAATSLSSFYEGIDTSREVDPHLTALGHSYGSLTTSLALQNGTGVDDAVLFGSPGLGTGNVADLGLEQGHLFLEEAYHDPVADFGTFGGDPSTLDGVTQLSTDARQLPDGTMGSASQGHSEYTDQGVPGTPGYRHTTAAYNMAAVVANQPDQAFAGSHPDQGDEARAGLARGATLVDTASRVALGPAYDPVVDLGQRVAEGAGSAAMDGWRAAEGAYNNAGDVYQDASAQTQQAVQWAGDRAEVVVDAADLAAASAADRAADLAQEVSRGAQDAGSAAAGVAADVAIAAARAAADPGRAALDAVEDVWPF